LFLEQLQPASLTKQTVEMTESIIAASLCESEHSLRTHSLLQ